MEKLSIKGNNMYKLQIFSFFKMIKKQQTLILNKYNNIHLEVELYMRITEVAQSAIRGLDVYKFITLEEAQIALAKFKRKHPKKSKARKKKVN